MLNRRSMYPFRFFRCIEGAAQRTTLAVSPCVNLLNFSCRHVYLNSTRLLMRKRFGQHLLKNPDVVAKIVELAEISPHETVFEIGPGTGNMTVHMLEQAKTVYAVELDTRLFQKLLERVRSMDSKAIENSVATSQQDSVPDVNTQPYSSKLQVVNDDFLRAPLPSFDALVANVPYQISSPILFRLFSLNPLPSRAIIMFQLEFAERLVAKPGSKDYCKLSVNTQLLAETKIVLHVGRTQFRPPPKVDSAVVRIVPRGWPKDLDFYDWDAFLRICFHAKNKTLRATFFLESHLARLTAYRDGGKILRSIRSRQSTRAMKLKAIAASKISDHAIEDSEFDAESFFSADESGSSREEEAALESLFSGFNSSTGDEAQSALFEQIRVTNSINETSLNEKQSPDLQQTSQGFIPRVELQRTKDDLDRILASVDASGMRANSTSVAMFLRIYRLLRDEGFLFMDPITPPRRRFGVEEKAVDPAIWLERAQAAAKAIQDQRWGGDDRHTNPHRPILESSIVAKSHSMLSTKQAALNQLEVDRPAPIQPTFSLKKDDGKRVLVSGNGMVFAARESVVKGIAGDEVKQISNSKHNIPDIVGTNILKTEISKKLVSLAKKMQNRDIDPTGQGVRVRQTSPFKP